MSTSPFEPCTNNSDNSEQRLAWVRQQISPAQFKGILEIENTIKMLLMDDAVVDTELLPVCFAMIHHGQVDLGKHLITALTHQDVQLLTSTFIRDGKDDLAWEMLPLLNKAHHQYLLLVSTRSHAHDFFDRLRETLTIEDRSYILRAALESDNAHVGIWVMAQAESPLGFIKQARSGEHLQLFDRWWAMGLAQGQLPYPNSKEMTEYWRQQAPTVDAYMMVQELKEIAQLSQQNTDRRKPSM